MGSSAYLATKSEREVYDSEMHRERKEMEEKLSERPETFHDQSAEAARQDHLSQQIDFAD